MVSRAIILATAFSLNDSGARPGGQDRHFWVPLKAASISQASRATSTPPREVTQSIIMSAPCSFAMATMSAIGWHTPVEVSAWTTARILGSLPFKASATASGVTARPHSASMGMTSAPNRPAQSTMRVPNTPLTTIATWSPGSTRLTKQASMPELPVPDTGIVSALSVRKTARNNACVSVIISRKSGSRCPRVGAAMARSTRGGTSLGPGPINTLTAGSRSR